MTQRFLHTLTNFVVVLTALFLAFGPLLSNLAAAQAPGDFEPPTDGYTPLYPEGDVDLGPFGGPGPDIDDDLDRSITEEEVIAAEKKVAEGNNLNGVELLNLSQDKNFETVYNFLVIAGGWVASWGGMLFDWAFERLVLEFGCWFVDPETVAKSSKLECTFGAGGVGGAVNQLWSVVRDLFNLVFIFSLVYIGLRLIVSADETTTQKTVGLLIAAALLVNFSLYIGKLVIDVSNFTAIQIHDAMVGGFTYEEGGYRVTDEVKGKTYTLIGSKGDESISGAFMQILYISTFFSSKSLVTDGPGALLMGVVAFIFLCYLGFVLAYGAAMVVVRFIALVILLIFSPAMFLGWVLPQFEQYSKQWRTNFVSYCFFIPAYVFLLYTSLFVLIQISEAMKSNADYGAVIAGEASGDGWSVFFLYMLGVGFLYASTKVAGMMSKSGAVVGMSSASRIANKFTAGAAVAASTMGIRGGSKWLGGRVSSSAAGYSAKKLGDLWDKRNARKDKPRGRTSIYLRNKLKGIEDKKFGGTTSFKSREEERKEERKRHATARGSQQIKDYVSDFENAGDNATQEQTVRMERAIADASGPQLEALGAKTLSNPIIAGSLSNSQFDNLMKSEKLNDKDKMKIGEARGENVKKKLTKNGKLQINKASVAQLQAMGGETMVNNAGQLTASQMDDLKKKLTESEFERIKEKREEQLSDMNPEDVFSNKDNKEIAKLPKDVLEDSASLEYLKSAERLTGDLLKQIARESKADKRKLGNYIKNLYGSYESLPDDVRGYLEGGEGSVYGVNKNSFSTNWSDPEV